MTRNLKLKVVSQRRLLEIAKKKSVKRIGSTGKPKIRRNSYTYQGYSGIMYCAPTPNKKKAENKLLRIRKYPLNKQRRSNAQRRKGNVYAIDGKKN